MKDKTIRKLGVFGTNPRYVSTGHVVFGRVDAAAAFAVPFDLRRLRVTGPTVAVLEGVLVKTGGATELSLSNDGSLLMMHGSAGSRIAILDEKRRVTELSTDVRSRGQSPRFSPDGKRVAMSLRQTNSTDVWIYDLSARTLTRLTTDGRSSYPAWTPDGKRIAFASGTGTTVALVIRNWDGSGKPDTLISKTRAIMQIAFAGHGKSFVLTQALSPGNADIYAGTLDSATKLQPVLTTGASEMSASISPDGRWLAYSSNETGTNQVYVMPFPALGGRFQVSTASGGEPLWSRDSRRLYYRSSGQLMVATLSLTREPSVVRRDTLFEDTFAPEGSRRAYDLSPDGKTFVVGRLVGDDARMLLVLNWFDELRDRMQLATKK